MKNTLLASLAMAVVIAGATTSGAQAQTTVTITGSESWLGYMAVFQNAGGPVGSKGAAAFDTTWGLSDLRSTIAGDTVVLEPNYNAYNASDPFWANGTNGNKWMEANTYVQNASWGGGQLTFEGLLLSTTLASPNFTASAFIKSFDGGWGWQGWSQDFITAGETNFSVTFNAPAGIVQYGFLVEGLNANPANTLENGSIVATGVPEPSTYAMLVLGAAGFGAHLLRRRRR
jgi:hypothetical protein